MSRLDRFNSALYELKRNYPSGVTTFGNCHKDGCSNSARGGGTCAKHLEAEIAEIIGNKILANKIHDDTKKAARNLSRALDFIEAADDTDT